MFSYEEVQVEMAEKNTKLDHWQLTKQFVWHINVGSVLLELHSFGAG